MVLPFSRCRSGPPGEICRRRVLGSCLAKGDPHCDTASTGLTPQGAPRLGGPSGVSQARRGAGPLRLGPEWVWLQARQLSSAEGISGKAVSQKSGYELSSPEGWPGWWTHSQSGTQCVPSGLTWAAFQPAGREGGREGGPWSSRTWFRSFTPPLLAGPWPELAHVAASPCWELQC